MTRQPNYEHYTPGVCNINPIESAYRRRIGYIFTGVAIAVLLGSLILNVPTFLAISLLFVSAFIATINFLQAKNNFCVAYASVGKFNVSNTYGETATATRKADRAKDRTRANGLYFYALLTAIAISAIGFAVLSSA